MLAPWKKSYDHPRQNIKTQRHYFADKSPSGQSYGFSSSHVWMWELGHKESWVPKNWCFWTVVLEKTLESPLDCKEIQPVHPKGNQSWIFTEGLMLKLKLQYSGHLMRRADSLEKTLMLGKIEGGRRGVWQRMRWLDGITDSMDMSLSESITRSWWWTGRPDMLQSMGSQRAGQDWVTELDWTHSSNLAWKILWTEEACRLQIMGFQESQALLRNYTTTAKIIELFYWTEIKFDRFLFSEQYP